MKVGARRFLGWLEESVTIAHLTVRQDIVREAIKCGITSLPSNNKCCGSSHAATPATKPKKRSEVRRIVTTVQEE